MIFQHSEIESKCMTFVFLLFGYWLQWAYNMFCDSSCICPKIIILTEGHTGRPITYDWHRKVLTWMHKKIYISILLSMDSRLNFINRIHSYSLISTTGKTCRFGYIKKAFLGHLGSIFNFFFTWVQVVGNLQNINNLQCIMLPRTTIDSI